jgi:hypothetical protein
MGVSSPPRRAGPAAAGLLLTCLPAFADAQLTPVFVIPTESRVETSAAADAPLRVELHGRDLAALARALRVPAPEAGARHLDYTLREYPVAVTSLDHSWLEPSFVIDLDEPAVVAMHEEFLRSDAGGPLRPRLVRFVADAIEETHGRGWDIASRVATRREGDCTEHAVLLTALARSSALPARVVLGVALVSAEGGYAAYGHAWSEVRDEGRWVVADAALAGLNAPVHYLPLGVLEQEGPGFFVSAAAFLQAWVQRVVVVGPRTPASAG